MFDNHQPIISTWTRQSPDNLARVLQFVILTIKQPLASVPGQLAALIENSPEADAYLWGFKGQACAEAWANRETVHSYLEHVAASDASDHDKACAMVEYLADLRGFGPVKAGFVTQLVYGLAGCIDTHNLTRFKIHPRTFSNFKQRKTAKARRAFIRRYVKTCDRLGGPAKLWDSWCEYVAANQPTTYHNAMHVSQLHCDVFGLTDTGKD